MSRKLLVIGFIVASLLMVACGGNAPQGARAKEPVRKAPEQAKASDESKAAEPAQTESAPPTASAEPAPAELSIAATQSPDSAGLLAGATGPSVDPKTGQKYLYKTDTYMVLSENPTVIQAIPKSPVLEEFEAWRKEREALPLVDDVMTEDELKSYMKEKNISLITKQNFKAPELLWERSFDEEIKHTGCLSDMTGKGNSLLLAGDPQKFKQTLLFLDASGKTRKKVAVDTLRGENLYFAMGGNAAIYTKSEALGPVDEGEIGIERVSATYYDEEGREVWSRSDLLTMVSWNRFYFSHNGSMFCLSEDNPHWGGGEYSLTYDLNCASLYFFNSAGERVLEYKNFRSLSVGAFSQDGQTFVGIFCWQKGDAISSRIVCFDLSLRKIRWERIFPSGIDDMMYSKETSFLMISEHGTYTAVTCWDDVPEDLRDRDSFHFANVLVMDKYGRAVSKIRGIWIESLSDQGYITLIKTRDSKHAFANVGNNKVLLVPEGYRYDFNPQNLLLLWDRGRLPKDRHYFITNAMGDILWDKMNPKLGYMKFSEDYRSIKGIGVGIAGENEIAIYDLANMDGGIK